MRTCLCFLLCGFIMSCVTQAQGQADDALDPPAQEMCSPEPADRWQVTNGSMQWTQVDGRSVLRWHINPGQTSQLVMNTNDPLFARLRYYDHLDLSFRLASGQINGLSLLALGHVSGPRSYKVHEWGLAVRTIAPGAWQRRYLELARPSWLPWDDADGLGRRGFFKLQALAMVPDTVIEIRGLTLNQARVLLKPDFETPITWPVLERQDNGDATYRLSHHLVNTAGRPAKIIARVVSDNPHFKVTVTPESLDLGHAAHGRFDVTATMARDDIAATPELYSEPLTLEFYPEDEPRGKVVWQGRLTRPLSPGVHRQVVVPEGELDTIRAALTKDDATIRKLVDFDRTKAAADEFLGKQLIHLPLGEVGGLSRGWELTDRMPEAINPETGKPEFATPFASSSWKWYLGNRTQLLSNVGLMYLYSRDEAYARKAVELFELYAQQYRHLAWHSRFDPPWNQGGPRLLSDSRVSVVSSYGTNIQFRHHFRLMSMIADSPSWSEESKQRIYREFVLPYATELIKFPGGINNMTDITNHNILLLGIVFDDANLVRWATLRDAGVVRRLEDIDEDGFSSEGRPMNYHLAAMNEYLPSVGYLDRSGIKLDFPKQRLLAAVRMPFLRAGLHGIVPSTGDTGRGQWVRQNPNANELIPIFPDQRWLYDAGASPLRLHLAGIDPKDADWRKLLSPDPVVFKNAGMAILREGDSVNDQIMVTLDYGRNVMHAAWDRQQITLMAFGRTFTHGPGSLYNVGSGGMIRNDDPDLEAFINHDSLSQNVIVVDQQNQLPAIGKLLAWHVDDNMQVAVSEVAGIQPGVTHTRGVVLTRGIVILLDRIVGDKAHTYDFVYHNFGELSHGKDWSDQPANQPLGTVGGYPHIVDLRQLTGSGTLSLSWDLTRQLPPAAIEAAQKKGEALPTIMLDLKQLPVDGGEIYTGSTGLNNMNTTIIPDAAPSLFHRVIGKTAEFATVLAPHHGESPVKSISGQGTQLTVTFTDDSKLTVTLDGLIEQYRVQPR